MFEQPAQVLDTWLEGVNSGELEKVASLYSQKAVLLPTFSNKRLQTPKDIQAYFAALGSHEGLRVSLHPDTTVIQRLSNAIHCLGGLYCWQFKIDAQLLQFEARFSFLVDLAFDAPIIHHHSSQIPRGL